MNSGKDAQLVTMSIKMENKENHTPQHVAIIMDGNGRWAQARGEDRSVGHAEGVRTVRKIVEEATRAGVKYLTLYTLSTENWNRPKEEIASLMGLIVQAIERETADLIKNHVRLTMIGDKSPIPPFALEKLEQCIADTSHCDGLTLILALSYSSRWEITAAARQLAAKAAAGEIDPDGIDGSMFSSCLTTAGIPDPDLLIRTGGDFRVSNFLLWQIAYSEIIVTSTYWPAYSPEEFRENLEEFKNRQRRFGLTTEQILGQ